MEEGQFLTGSGLPSPQRPASPASRILAKMLDTTGWPAVQKSQIRPLPLSLTSIESGSRSGRSSPLRASPIRRSFSYPTAKSQNGSSESHQNGVSGVGSSLAAASSYIPGSPRLQDGGFVVSNGSVASLTSRSRNSSRLDLPSLMPRQQISRTN